MEISCLRQNILSFPSGIKRIYHPESFQGVRYLREPARGKGYFEGWYFKLASVSGAVIAFIPGVSLSDDPHAFIQVNDGREGRGFYYRFPLESFKASHPGEAFWVEIAGSRFSLESVKIDLSEGGRGYSADLSLEGVVHFPARLFSPGIMGWYSFLPFMECYHGLVSLDHELSGTVTTPSAKIDFSGGRGYIEKDWGRSFPEAWIWMQVNLPERASFMFSLARIPWLGKSFPGFLCILHSGGKTRVFATYNGAKIVSISATESSVQVVIERKKQVLRINASYGTAGTLSAPVSGRMDRPIRESVDSKIIIEFLDGADGYSYSGEGRAAGFEMAGAVDRLIGELIIAKNESR